MVGGSQHNARGATFDPRAIDWRLLTWKVTHSLCFLFFFSKFLAYAPSFLLLFWSFCVRIGHELSERIERLQRVWVFLLCCVFFLWIGYTRPANGCRSYYIAWSEIFIKSVGCCQYLERNTTVMTTTRIDEWHIDFSLAIKVNTGPFHERQRLFSALNYYILTLFHRNRFA